MQCTAVLNVAGEHFNCDMDAPHDGWGHANKMAQAIWTGTDKEPCERDV